MAVIERCLSLGIIKEGSILILDEPEIHLHPEWQLKYAEFIIILQKALNLTVLITTHSPQFLRAIECYMDKYEIMDRLNVYSIENGSITNVSYSEYGISEIYDKLSKPYDELQQMLDEKYGSLDNTSKFIVEILPSISSELNNHLFFSLKTSEFFSSLKE